VKHAPTLLALLLFLSACSGSDKKTRGQIAGTWSQGTNHTLTLSSDGSFISIFRGFPDGRTDTWQGKWSIKQSRLIMTDVRSNSIAVSELPSRIVSLDDHGLCLEAGEHMVSLTR
jgi:hypothetical protein